MKKAENKIFNMMKSKADTINPNQILTISVVKAFFLLSISFNDILYSINFVTINESPLKTPSSNLTIFYFKIGQPVSFDFKKDKTKNWTHFLTNLNQGFKKQTVSGFH